MHLQAIQNDDHGQYILSLSFYPNSTRQALTVASDLLGYEGIRPAFTDIQIQDLRVGNKYRIGRKIGSGSFGDIYLGMCLLDFPQCRTGGS